VGTRSERSGPVLNLPRLLAAVALPVAGLTFLLVPTGEAKPLSMRERLRKLDLIGVLTLTGKRFAVALASSS
jgi:hypothetical protein